ncbi:hypothetical protein [Streptococcus suis]|uniref:hypothetical protein n=1 Tax=Streptococcus suis TaxID=1307 RepID=UPI000CF50B2F|nr:hypothetical protein [Streptococcus suis]
MNVIKDLATVISMIVSTITIAGIYYSDNGEVEKRKKIFLKNIAIIIVFTILLWMFSIYLFRIYFQTDLLTVLSLVNPTLVFFFILCTVTVSMNSFIYSRKNFLSSIKNDEIIFVKKIKYLTIQKKLNRGKFWKYSQSYFFPFIKSVVIGVYILLGILSIFIIFIDHLDNEVKQFPFQSLERFYIKKISDGKVYSIDTETDFDIVMTSEKKVPQSLYSIEDNIYSLPIDNQRIKLKKGTKLFESSDDKVKIYRNNKESATVNKVKGKTFLILEQDDVFDLVSDSKRSTENGSYLFLSNQYRKLEKEMQTVKSLILPGIIGFIIFGLTFLLTNFYFFPLIIVILGGTIDIVLLQINNDYSFIATVISILVALYFLICIVIYDSFVVNIHKSKDTIKLIKYQYKKFSYQIRKQDLIENLLNDRTRGCHEVKFPYLVGENRTEPKIIFFIYQNYWDILRLPILYFKCKKH